MRRRTKTADPFTCRPPPRPRLEQSSEIARAEMLNVCDSVEIGARTLLLHEWQIFKNWLSMYADSGKNKTIIGQIQQRKINVHKAMWILGIVRLISIWCWGLHMWCVCLYVAYECERFHASKKRIPNWCKFDWCSRRAWLELLPKMGLDQLEFIGTEETDGITTVWEIMIIEMWAAVFSNEERRKCRRYFGFALRHILIKLPIVLEILHCQAAG